MKKSPAPLPLPYTPPEPRLLKGSPIKREPQHDKFGFMEVRRDNCPAADDNAAARMLQTGSSWGERRAQQDTQVYRDAGNLPDEPALKNPKGQLPVVNLTGRR